MFCIFSYNFFSGDACSVFPFQLPSLQCQLPHSEPIKHWFVCARKTCSPAEELDRKCLQLHVVTQLQEESVVLTAWPSESGKGVLVEICYSLTKALMGQTVTASEIPVLWSPQLTSLYRKKKPRGRERLLY